MCLNIALDMHCLGRQSCWKLYNENHKDKKEQIFSRPRVWMSHFFYCKKQRDIAHLIWALLIGLLHKEKSLGVLLGMPHIIPYQLLTYKYSSNENIFIPS